MARRKADVDVVLVTGAAGFLGRRLSRWLLENRPKAVVVLLCDSERELAMQEFISSLPEEQALRCRLVTGSVTSMDLGLTSDEYRSLSNDVTEVLHVDESTKGSRRNMRLSNVEGTREALEFAGSCQRLRRFCHLSSVEVSGDRQGVVMEDELEMGQSFLDDYQRTKYEAERIVARWGRRIPVTVVRAGLVIGDSRSGQMDEESLGFEVLSALAFGRWSVRASAPFHVVPWDALVEAIGSLAFEPSAVSRTFHVVDPTPLSVERAADLLSRLAHRRRRPGGLSDVVRRVLPLVPGVPALVGNRLSGAPAFLSTMVFYNASNAVKTLGGVGSGCPGLEEYAEVLVRFLRASLERSRRADADSETHDPLDS